MSVKILEQRFIKTSDDFSRRLAEAEIELRAKADGLDTLWAIVGFERQGEEFPDFVEQDYVELLLLTGDSADEVKDEIDGQAHQENALEVNLHASSPGLEASTLGF